MRHAIVSGLILALATAALSQEASALRQIDQGADYTATVDWENGYVEVVGEATCDPTLAVNQGHCYTMAIKAARALAYEKLAETVHGLHISSSNTFQDEVIANTTLRTAVNGLIKNARIISEDTVTMPDGSPLARVKLGVMIFGPRGLGAAAVQHSSAPAVAPQMAKLRADMERAMADLDATKHHAQRLETLVQQASQAAQDARRPEGRPDDQTAARALEQAAAALRIAEEARKAAAAVTISASEAQSRQGQSVSPDEARQAKAALAEAREIADRVAAAAAEAQAAATEARQASATATQESRHVADMLQKSQETAQQVEAARSEADRMRRDNELALARIAQAQSALAADNSSASQALAEARQAANEAREAREQAVTLERRLRETRFAVDSLTSRSTADRDVEIARLAAETQRLAQELGATRQKQAQLETEFEKGATTAMAAVGSGDKAAQALAEARQASDEARRARERADGLERQLQDARSAVDKLPSKPAQEREQEIVRLSAETKRLADELASARQKQSAFEAQTTSAMSRLSTEDNAALAQALAEARAASQEAKAAREKAVALERHLSQARLASESAATTSGAQRDAQIKALAAQTQRLAEELAASRARQAELERETMAAMSQATKAVETGSRSSPEVAALVADLKKSQAQTQALQAAVAALEKRAAMAETQTEAMRKLFDAGTASRADMARASEQAAAAARAVQSLRDSLKTAPRSIAPVPATSVARVVELSKEPYTGLIVDAAYLGVRPATKSRIFSPDGEEVYGDSKASRSVQLTLGGLTRFADTPEAARTKHVSVIGSNPLIVKAVEATGKNRSDVVVSREDAVLIDRADRAGGFLKNCKVAITVEPTA